MSDHRDLSHIPLHEDESQRIASAFFHAFRAANREQLNQVVVAVDSKGTLVGTISATIGDEICNRLMRGSVSLSGLRLLLATPRSKAPINSDSVLLALLTKEPFTDKLLRLPFRSVIYVPLHLQEQQSYLLRHRSIELPVSA